MQGLVGNFQVARWTEPTHTILTTPHLHHTNDSPRIGFSSCKCRWFIEKSMKHSQNEHWASRRHSTPYITTPPYFHDISAVLCTKYKPFSSFTVNNRIWISTFNTTSSNHLNIMKYFPKYRTDKNINAFLELIFIVLNLTYMNSYFHENFLYSVVWIFLKTKLNFWIPWTASLFTHIWFIFDKLV